MGEFDRQCVIHSHSSCETRDALAKTLSRQLSFPYGYGGLKGSWVNIDVSKKDDWHRINFPNRLENFELELIAKDEVPADVFKTNIRSFLKTLDLLGYKPIPACDFENELEGWESDS